MGRRHRARVEARAQRLDIQRVEGVGDRADGFRAEEPGRAIATVLATRVMGDRQLLLVLWADREEVGRYVSDPSYGPGADDDTLPDPLGVEHAAAFAAACGRPEAAEDLAELLAEELDPESVIESERLFGVLRLLGLPTWLVAASSLPRDVPTGPPGVGRDAARRRCTRVLQYPRCLHSR